MAHHVASGVADLGEAFRRTVAEFEGSVAIGAAAADQPDRLYLALRGSGQALYVGLADDCYIVASEPYGVVEETTQFIRMDGETPSPSGSRGQVFVLDGAQAGDLAGSVGSPTTAPSCPSLVTDVATAQVTTRDIDRGDSPHYLLKEIGEAPASFRKTVRGKIVEVDGLRRASVGARALPADIRARLADGSITKIKVIGQGTAAVAGRSMAAVLDALTDGQIDIDPITATELSGFGMRLDMSDTLVVAVSQSGTTTDTNRTVDLVRSRGAAVIGIVNRRNSDLTDKADGVMYTSDGRDVEMSVASTKAFYAQVAAGVLLACAITEAANLGSAAAPARPARHRCDSCPRRCSTSRPARCHRRRGAALCPAEALLGHRRQRSQHRRRRRGADQAQRAVLQVDRLRHHRRQEAHRPVERATDPGVRGRFGRRHRRRRRQGSGDLQGPQSDAIVVATEGDERFAAAAAVLTVPSVDSALAFVLSAMVGHLFGYEAALAIDASARPLREAREVIEHGADDVRQRRRRAPHGSPRHRSACRPIRRGPALRPVRRASRSIHRCAAVGVARRPARRSSRSRRTIGRPARWRRPV